MQTIDSPDEPRKTLKNFPLISGTLVTVVFSLVLSINLILKVGDVCNDAGFPEIVILIIDFSIRFLSGAICVIVIIPFILNLNLNKNIFKKYLKEDIRLKQDLSMVVTSFWGVFSALVFFTLCFVIGTLLGVLNLDFSLIFSQPTEGFVGWFIFLYAIIPALWEEMTFRGVILHGVMEKYDEKAAILVSSLLFGLFHFSSLLVQPFEMVFFYFIMATLYGIAWGYLVVKCDNILPGIIAHYLIDAFGTPFINIISTDQATVGIFFMSTSFLYPLITVIVARYFFRKRNFRQ